MSSPAFEAFLVEILLDPEKRERFLVDPRAVAIAAGLSETEAASLAAIDRVGLTMTANSLAKKRLRVQGL